MQLELQYFTDSATPENLMGLLRSGGNASTQSFGELVDFDPVSTTLTELLASNEKVSSWDARLAPVLHGSLRRCSRRMLLDMNLWHWLAITELRGFVLRRWCGISEVTSDTVLKPNQMGHFLGQPTLNGVSRNGLARLFWAAEALHTDADGYGLIDKAFSSQDLYKGIFERKFCLYPPAARVCARVLADLEEDEQRRQLKLLNLFASTIVLESLDEPGVEELIEKCAAA